MISRTAFGQMMDFLKNFPFVTREEYLWEWTMPQIMLALSDSTHLIYKKDKDKKRNVYSDGSNLEKVGATMF